MSYEVSKELFEAVTKISINSFVIDAYNEDLESNIVVDISTESHRKYYRISYSDFYFMCKYWAVNNGYVIHSHIKHTYGNAQAEWYEKNHKDKHGTYREHKFYSEWFKVSDNNEQQAVFNACQWVLDIKN